MFDTTPKPWMLKGKKNEKWNASGACSEIIDNSYGAKRGDATEVHLTWDNHHRILEILDNGRGMDNIGRLFQFGNTIGTAAKDAGMYGSGGTQAILWLPHRVDVWTLRDGQVAHVTITWNDRIYKADHFPMVDDSWRKATMANTPMNLYEIGHGTLIRMHVGKERRIISSNIRRDLAFAHAPAIRAGKILTWNGERIANPISMDELTQVIKLALVVEVRNEEGELDNLGVQGEIGIIPDLSQAQSRVHIGYAYRTVDSTRDCFSSYDGTERYSGVGITGWLDLSDEWRPYLALTKDEVHHKAAWDILMGHVFDKIKDLLRSLDEEKHYIILDNIKLALSNAFDGNVEIEIPAGITTVPEFEKPDVPNPFPNPSPNPRPTPVPPGDEKKRKDRTPSKIDIVELSDKEMDSILCKAEAQMLASGPCVAVYVNGDHRLVQKALSQAPPNQELVNILVIGQIAAVLVDTPSVAEVVLPKPMLKVIDGKDERMQEGLLSRMLVDNARLVG